MAKHQKPPWYHQGLQFTCQGCGQCCSGPGEGYVWVTPEEIAAMAKALQIDEPAFRKQFVRRPGRNFSLRERPDTKDCVFLDPLPDAGRGCRVYHTRPLQCRTWPFWKENLHSPDTWRLAGNHCPGIDQGRHFDPELIQRIQSGDPDALSTDTPTSDPADRTAAGASIVDPAPPVSTQKKDPPAARTDRSTSPDDDPLGQALDWIARHRRRADIILAVADIYAQIDNTIDAIGPTCDACGRCCDFETFGHRLYATTLEMLVFLTEFPRKSTEKPRKCTKNTPISPKNHPKSDTFPPEKDIFAPRIGNHSEHFRHLSLPFSDNPAARIATPRQPLPGLCPAAQNGACSNRHGRVSGCRIYFCRNLPADFQSDLSEQVLDRLRALHDRLQAPYCYADLRAWLAHPHANPTP